jgi:hypothetical protein
MRTGRTRWLTLAAGASVALVGAGVAFLWRRRRQFDATIRDRVDALLTDAETPAASADLAALPAPVRRYFETVLPERQPPVRTVRLVQHGEFRLGGPDADWKPLTATQHVSVDPPGFVWDAEIAVAPALPARVLDGYRDGEGLLRARLRGAIPVASAGPDPAMNEGELVRYLAEAVWYPTALLPAAGVEWEPVDDESARATLSDGDVTASVVFEFADDGTVARVTAERYRQEDDSYATWVGRFHEYERRNGMLVPTAAEVAWDLPDGEIPYWRATVTDVQYAAATG